MHLGGVVRNEEVAGRLFAQDLQTGSSWAKAYNVTNVSARVLMRTTHLQIK